jgi:hypothetical protein
MTLYKRIFSQSQNIDFECIALDVFDYQFKNCPIYKQYVTQLDWSKPECIEEIPFLPVSFFKSHHIICEELAPEIVFKSSGTSGIRSTHLIAKKSSYIDSFNATYNEVIGNPKDQVILALLPNYIEQGDSSLVYMIEHLIEQTKNDLSGFYLHAFEDLILSYEKAVSSGKQVVLFGVSFALLDLAELSPDLSKAIIIETGGMKGRREELTKQGLHEQLIKGFGCEYISSEYGMTELLSQAYSRKDGVFAPGRMMEVFIREVNDPFRYVDNGNTGGINIVDIANIHSCSFIATNDLGRKVDGGFELMGRYDGADIRGCNLLVH